MSYTPTFAILKSDLDKHKDYILNGNWQWAENHTYEYRVMKEIEWFYKHKIKPYKLQSIEFYLISYEFRDENLWLKAKLQELNIEFDESQ